jgi:hypothetical protein
MMGLLLIISAQAFGRLGVASNIQLVGWVARRSLPSSACRSRW